MIKTSKELMEWLGLQVGDRVKVNFTSNMFQEDLIYEVVDDKIFVNQIHLKVVNTKDFIMIDLNYLVNIDFEILPRPKRVGDLKCKGFGNCGGCPLYWLSCDYSNGGNLYEALEDWFENSKDQEIYDLLKARLDKEVVE